MNDFGLFSSPGGAKYSDARYANASSTFSLPPWFQYAYTVSQFFRSRALSPGTNFKSCGPIFKNDKYPTSLSSSLPLPNLASTAFTAGGGPAFCPLGAAIWKEPTDVQLMSSSADSNTNRKGMSAMRARNHSTWS